MQRLEPDNFINQRSAAAAKKQRQQQRQRRRRAAVCRFFRVRVMHVAAQPSGILRPVNQIGDNSCRSVAGTLPTLAEAGAGGGPKKIIQICQSGCLSHETVTSPEQHSWCEALYEAKAAELILYGRALGLGHGEAEDVVQETFLALMQMPQCPREPEHYCVRSFRNRARNHHRSLWRRLTRELESRRWFEKSPDESEAERAAMACLAGLAGGPARSHRAENLAPVHVRGDRRVAGSFPEHGGGPLSLRFAENQIPTGRRRAGALWRAEGRSGL